MKTYLLLFSLLTATLYAQTNEAPLVTAIDGYAAQVNTRVITYGDVRRYVNPFIRQVAQELRGDALAGQIQTAYIDGREALIEEALYLEEAKRLEYQLPETAIEQEVTRVIRERFDNNQPLLRKALAEQRMTLDEWKQEIADQLLVRIFYNQEVLQKISVSEEAIQSAYEELKGQFAIPFRVKYSFILISKGNTEEERIVKRKQAESTLEKLRNGTAFPVLATEVSEGDTSISPWRDPADVRAELQPALRELPAGSFSELIETDRVFYIVYINERQEAGYTPLEDVRADIEASLRNAERQRLQDELNERLSQLHYVKRF
jgi:peptidyl-prolyl cis-trans isomerase SurA